GLRFVRERLPPAPRRPSRLEVQTMAPVRLPSSRSLAVAVKGTAGPCGMLALLAGAGAGNRGGAVATPPVFFCAGEPPGVGVAGCGGAGGDGVRAGAQRGGAEGAAVADHPVEARGPGERRGEGAVHRVGGEAAEGDAGAEVEEGVVGRGADDDRRPGDDLDGD